MMVIIENIIDKYYYHSTEILHLLLGFFAIFTICGFIYTFSDDISCCLKDFIKFIGSRFHATSSGECYCKTSRKRIRNNINKLIYKIIYSAILVGIGELLSLMGAKLDIEYFYFNAVVFIVIVWASVAYGILLCLMFWQILLPIQQCCRHIQFFIFLELFLLAITQHLDFLEWGTAVLGILSAEVMVKLLDKRILKQKEKIEKENKNKGYDYPDPDLYPTRKRQLERFIAVLKEQRNEPYAVMISGEWGKGKTSFVQALENALKESCFIWVCAGSEKSVLEIMSEISDQIVSILKENNVFLERRDLVEKYFLAFSDLLEDTALKPLRKMAGVIHNKKSLDEREYINSKLDELDKDIYLVVDDLDRCGGEYQSKMFKVIRESMELHSCKTIVLVDKTKFLQGEENDNYIEKYVNYTLDICEVEYSEIIEDVIEDILDNRFIENMSTVLLRDRNTEQIRDKVCKFPIYLIDKIEEEISKEENQQNKKTKNDKKILEFKQAILRIKEDIVIPRKVKNYLKGIKRAADAFSNGIDMIDGELLGEDWLDAIIKVQYVKNFMPKEFNDIRMSRDIYEFFQIYNQYTLDIIFDLKYLRLIHNEKQEIILNLIIYKIDVIDFSQVRTMREKRLFELHNGCIVISRIKEYLDIAQTYDDLQIILDIYERQNFSDKDSKDEFIKAFFEVLCQQTSPFKADTKEYLNFSKQFMECLIRKGLSNGQKIVCVKGGNMIVTRTIEYNARSFKNILYMLFDLTDVMDKWDSLAATDINGFYEVLKKIDKAARFKGLESETDKLLSIRTYYGNLKVELQKKQYERMKSTIDQMFSDVEIIFEICEFWSNIEYTINNISQEENMILLKKYFILDNGYTLRESSFHSVSDFIEALIVLKKVLTSTSKENDNDTDYMILLSLLMQRVVLQCEQKQLWFGDKKDEVAKLVSELAEMVGRLDSASDYFRKDTVTKIKIYAYKFNEYCEKVQIEKEGDQNQ